MVTRARFAGLAKKTSKVARYRKKATVNGIALDSL